jgi:hypothetical protein
MNPLTDKLTSVPLPDGRTLEIVQPGALARPDHSKNELYSRDSYLRYAQHLELAISNMEKGLETEFNVPVGLSANTFCARFRSARKALILFNYDPALRARLVELSQLGKDPTISLAQDGRSVWFRRPSGRGRAVKLSRAVDRQQHGHGLILPALKPLPAEDDLRAMCTLAKSGLLSGQVVFKGIIPADTIAALEAEFDVAVTVDVEQETSAIFL